MPLVLIAVLTSFGYGLYNYFLKISADKISPLLATFYLCLTAAVVSGLALLFFSSFHLLPETHTTKDGVKYVIFAGIATGVADLLYFILFSRGFSLSVGFPSILAGAVIIALIFSLIFLHEKLTITSTIGLVMALVGIVLLSH